MKHARRLLTTRAGCRAPARRWWQVGGSIMIGKAGDPFGSMDAAKLAAQSYLLKKLRPFHVSPEYWACARLFRAAPRAVSIADFTLFRRFGKGSFGQVFAAVRHRNHRIPRSVCVACRVQRSHGLWLAPCDGGA